MFEVTHSKWLAGVAAPLLLVIAAIRGIATGHTLFPSAHRGGGRASLYLTGTEGRMLALTYFSFAAALHLHAFQAARHPDAGWPARVGNVFVVLALCGLGYSFFHLFDMLAL